MKAKKVVYSKNLLIDFKNVLNTFKITNKNIGLKNPFHSTGRSLYPLKTSENQRLSDVFRGYRKRLVASKWLMCRIDQRIFQKAYYVFNDASDFCHIQNNYILLIQYMRLAFLLGRILSRFSQAMNNELMNFCDTKDKVEKVFGSPCTVGKM